MFKNIISIILAIGCGWLILKLIGMLFTIAFFLFKIIMLAVIAIPAYFLIKKALAKF